MEIVKVRERKEDAEVDNVGIRKDEISALNVIIEALQEQISALIPTTITDEEHDRIIGAVTDVLDIEGYGILIPRIENRIKTNKIKGRK